MNYIRDTRDKNVMACLVKYMVTTIFFYNTTGLVSNLVGQMPFLYSMFIF